MKRADIALPGQLPHLNYYIRKYFAMCFHQSAKVHFKSAVFAGDYKLPVLLVLVCLFDHETHISGNLDNKGNRQHRFGVMDLKMLGEKEKKKICKLNNHSAKSC